ncbi:hypothetical protein PMG71_03945 [Roseofilum sp. BLCC_M154]|uniref:Uncharacterized protein n=1 Tax=Roseofilum acuticapitatum BLCC-M154 TaxID=3022444 RepID=A0ABT7ANU7_9CYAN|nr:hypothetical protein [Roseofilum acuticapitatum]MDJ1168573.1 hypothetical protein [Roseofilum acuticapitatum BLCC-M154]
MWEIESEEIKPGRIIQYRIRSGDSYLCVQEVLELWQDNPDFRLFYSRILADRPFTAFRWETPPCTWATRDRLFEYVLIDQPSLCRPPDPDAFKTYFDSASPEQTMVSFPNLSGDAHLIVPCAIASDSVYVHLAAFVREAPESQQHQLWATVAREMTAQLQRSPQIPIWLNTAGMGVPWLHIRLDSRPKYYSYTPYKFN